MKYVLWNGECVGEEEALLPFNERAFLYGDGVFTTLLVADGMICFLKEHLAHFASDCAALQISPPEINPQHLADLIYSNNALTGEWRLKIYVTGGRAESLDLPKGRRGITFATLTQYKREEQKGCRLKTFPQAISGPLTLYKTMAYLERLYMKQYAVDNGCDDVLVASPEGYLMDASFSNLFWTDGSSLYVPSIEMNYQVGVTIGILIAQAKMPVIYGKWTLGDLPDNASLYRCNSLMGVQAVTQVDERMFVGNKSFENSIVAAYRQQQKTTGFVVTSGRLGDTCEPCG